MIKKLNPVSIVTTKEKNHHIGCKMEGAYYK